MLIFYYILVFVFGLLIGSFLNVLIYRLPKELNVIVGRSFCPTCKHMLSWCDLFPVFSYLFLGRKCRYCKTKISPRYMIVELLNAVLYLFYAIKFGYSITTLGYLIFASSLLCIIFIDAEHMIIPDGLNIAIAIAGVLMFFTKELPFYERIIGFFLVSAILLLIAIISKETAMGYGDVILTAVAGVVLGYKQILLALVVGAFLGSITSIIFNVIKKRSGKETSNLVPFGPYLAVGMLFASFFGNNIISWYLNLLR